MPLVHNRWVSDEVRLWLLGGFRAEVDGQPVAAAWRRSGATALVKLLALRPGHRLHREQAIDKLWPEAGATAGAARLNKALHFARRALGHDHLRLHDDLLVTDCDSFPGRAVPPWPAAVSGEDYTPPVGRGYIRLVSDNHTGRCAVCGRAWPRLADGKLTAHRAQDERCAGSGLQPGEDAEAASWLPVLRGLTPHGLRHGLQTWMDEDGIPEVLKTERMGHELPGMHGVYGHVSPDMRAELKAALQERWKRSLRQRSEISERSSVRVLDDLLAARCQHPVGRLGEEPSRGR